MEQQNRKIGFTTHIDKRANESLFTWDVAKKAGECLKVKVKIAAAAQMDLRVANFN